MSYKKDQKRMTEMANAFYDEIKPQVNFVILQYLNVWFKQIFESKKFKKIFKNNNVSGALAFMVTRFFMGIETIPIPDNCSSLFHERMNQVEKHVEKWADDIIRNGKEAQLAEFIMQTIKMENIFIGHATNLDKKYKEQRNEELTNLMIRYGDVGVENKDLGPDGYTELLESFLSWRNQIEPVLDSQGKGEWLDPDVILDVK